MTVFILMHLYGFNQKQVCTESIVLNMRENTANLSQKMRETHRVYVCVPFDSGRARMRVRVPDLNVPARAQFWNQLKLGNGPLLR